MAADYVFYYRSGEEDRRNISTVKFDLSLSARNPRTNGRLCAAALDGNHPFSANLRKTIARLSQFGLRDYAERRIREGKHFCVGTSSLPVQVLRDLGWRVVRYPHKYLPVLDKSATLERAQRFGLHIDGSNIIFNRHNPRGALSLKALIDWNSDHHVDWHVYLDGTTWAHLWRKDRGGYHFLQSFYKNAVDGKRRINTPSMLSAKTADDLMFDFADIHNGALVSRDEFDEWDYLGWTLRGAESGEPRLHKFFTDESTISIPDIGLHAKIPTTY